MNKLKSPYQIEAIPTLYRGFGYRSKLEAHFASFFCYLGLCFDYEPRLYRFEDGSAYLPDFKLYFPDNSIRWIEAKGPKIYRGAYDKAYNLAKKTGIITQIWCGSWGAQIIHSFVPYKKRVVYSSHNSLDAKWFEFYSKSEIVAAGQAAFRLV